MLTIVLLITLAVLIYIKVVKPYSYWTARGVKQRKPFYLLGDSAGPILGRESFYQMLKNIYDDFPGERYFGMYQMTSPIFMVKDPDLIKLITIKDFDHFVNHRPLFPEGPEPIWNKNLLSLKDDEWRQMRATLSPSFTSSKMKSIFNTICECSKLYIKYFQNTNGASAIELKDVMTRYTNDVIASVAYGVKCDSINHRENEFYVMGKEMTSINFKRFLTFLCYTTYPSLFKMFGIDFFPKTPTEFFNRIATDTIKVRREQGIVRSDMIHLLMQVQDGKTVEGEPTAKLSDEDIASQAFIFFLGGFESVSTTLCFLGYELAINPDIQRRLQEEVDETIKNIEGILTYETLSKMPYMDMVVSETLRKWPSNSFMDRVCTKPYLIPPFSSKENAVHLQPGDSVMIPIYGLHHDSKHFPNPERFDPERFNTYNKSKIHPFTYMPFGLGPRNCIGSRLALMKVKTLYFHLLAHFDLVRIEKTEVPLTMSKTTFVLLTQNGIWVGIKPRIK